MASLDIVIVNYNAGGHLADCLASLPAALRDGVTLGRVVVVDNASADGSADVLPALDPPVTVIRNAVNRGFAAACNQGAAGSRADYLLLLNPDTRLFPASLSVPLAFLERPENAGIGLLGIQLLDREGQVARSCARFPAPLRMIGQSFGLDRLAPRLVRPHFLVEWDHGATRDVDQVMGAFLLIRRGVFEALGGFDERFFVYYDDVDLCLRARQRGWRTVHFAGAQAFHHGGGTTERIKARRLFYMQRSRIQFAFKHFPPVAALAVTAAIVMLEPPARLLQALARGSCVQAGEALAGCARLWASLPGLLLHRR